MGSNGQRNLLASANASIGKYLWKQNTSCFICQTRSAHTDFPLEVETHSIRYICQYLKINRDVISKLALKGSLDKQQNFSYLNKWKDFVVELCSECAAVITKLTDFLKVLEIAQMRVDYQMKLFHQILKRQQEYSRKPKSVAGPGSVKAKAELEQRFRDVITKKCSAKINRILDRHPKILLKRVTENSKSTISGPFIVSDYAEACYDDIQKTPDLTVSSDNENEDCEDDIFADIKENKKSPSLQNTTLAKVYDKYFPDKHATGMLKCPVCNYKFRWINGKRHLVKNHSELFFASVKLDNLTEEQFRLSCAKLLNLESATHSKTKAPDGRAIYGCDYCQQTIHRIDQFLLHLVHKHYDILAKTLIRLQRDLKSRELNMKKGIFKQKVRRPRNGNRHEKDVKIPEESVNEQPCVESADIVVNSECSDAGDEYEDVQSNSSQEQHSNIVSNCDAIENQSHSLEVVKKYTGNAETNRLLERSPKIQLERVDIPQQVNEEEMSSAAEEYYDEPLETADHLDNCSDNETEDCHKAAPEFPLTPVVNKPVKADVLFAHFKKFQRKKGNYDSHISSIYHSYFPNKPTSRQLYCPVCNYQCYWQNGKRHMVKKHSELFLASVKLDSVSEQEFRLCCAKLMNLEPNSHSRTKKKGREIFGCGYCQEAIQRKDQFLMHLMHKHYNVLSEKLIGLQNDLKAGGREAKKTKRKKAVIKPKRTKRQNKISNMNQVEIPKVCLYEPTCTENVDIKVDPDLLEDLDYSEDLHSNSLLEPPDCLENRENTEVQHNSRNIREKRTAKANHQEKKLDTAADSDEDFDVPAENCDNSTDSENETDYGSKKQRKKPKETVENRKRKKKTKPIIGFAHYKKYNTRGKTKNALGASILSRVYKKYFPKKPAGTHQSCPICRIKFHKSYDQRHLLKKHSELFFADLKLKHVSSGQFKFYCQRLLSLESEAAPKSFTENKFNIVYGCDYCLESVIRNDQFLVHLVRHHYNVLKQKLIHLQGNPNQDKAEELSEMVANRPKRKRNENCESDTARKLSSLGRIENVDIKVEPGSSEPVEWHDDDEADLLMHSPEIFGIEDASKSLVKDLVSLIRPHLSRIALSNNFECQLCQFICSSWDCSTHFCTNHPEVLFEHIKLPHVSNEQFVNCCRYAITAELCFVATETEKGLPCPYCSDSVIFHQNESTHQLRFHLVVAHAEILQERIISIQNSGNIDSLALLGSNSEQSRARPSSKSQKCSNWLRFLDLCKTVQEKDNDDSNKWKCTLCNAAKLTLNPPEHFLAEHPETLFESYRPENITDKQFQTLCSNVLYTESEKTIKYETNVKGRYAYKCHLCDVKCMWSENKTWHLASKHFDVLEQSLLMAKNVEENLSSECKIVKKAGIRDRTKFLLSKCLQARLEYPRFTKYLIAVRNKHRCVFCKTYSTRGTSFMEHLVEQHVNEVFKDMQLEGVSTDQFRFCCEQFLKSEVNLGQRETGSDLQCNYCKTEVKTEIGFRCHLVDKHYELMEEGLVRLQTEEAWICNETDCSVNKKRKIEYEEPTTAEANDKSFEDINEDSIEETNEDIDEESIEDPNKDLFEESNEKITEESHYETNEEVEANDTAEVECESDFIEDDEIEMDASKPKPVETVGLLSKLFGSKMDGLEPDMFDID